MKRISWHDAHTQTQLVFECYFALNCWQDAQHLVLATEIKQ